MGQVLGAGALGRPRGMGWGGRWEVGSGWGTHVNPWLIHVNVWQKSVQYCKVISLQLIKINEKKKRKDWKKNSEKSNEKDLSSSQTLGEKKPLNRFTCSVLNHLSRGTGYRKHERISGFHRDRPLSER